MTLDGVPGFHINRQTWELCYAQSTIGFGDQPEVHLNHTKITWPQANLGMEVWVVNCCSEGPKPGRCVVVGLLFASRPGHVWPAWRLSGAALRSGGWGEEEKAIWKDENLTPMWLTHLPRSKFLESHGSIHGSCRDLERVASIQASTSYIHALGGAQCSWSSPCSLLLESFVRRVELQDAEGISRWADLPQMTLRC